jgi:LysM repeat protein
MQPVCSDLYRGHTGCLLFGYALGRKTDPGKLFDWSRIHFNQNRTGLPVHTVMKGESLYLISRKYSIPINSIAEWNNIDPNRHLRIGQKLSIPIYTVQPGDSFWKIAQKYNVSIETITRINKLDPNSYLRVGDFLKTSPSKKVIIEHASA